MNLKEAASRLGVHYQTAYRWVRAGDLAAVRVGSRYEVSNAAIHQFVAARQSVLAQAIPRINGTGAHRGDPEELLVDLEAMAGDPLLSVPSITNLVARRGSEVLGDLCIVAFTNAKGGIERASVDHVQADRAAFVAAAFSVTSVVRPGAKGLISPVLDSGQVVRIPHVPQDRLRAGIRPELRQYLVDHPIHSLLAAPIHEGGDVRGLIAFARDTPTHPFTEHDEQFVVRFAARIGTLVTVAREIADAWRARDRLAARFRDLLAASPLGAELEPAAVQRVMAEDNNESVMAVVYGPDARIIGATAATYQTSGYTPETMIGLSFADVIDEADIPTERENFARLSGGEIDYHDFHAGRRFADGSYVEIAMHRVAVRHLDSSLACVVSVSRIVPVSARVHDLIGAHHADAQT